MYWLLILPVLSYFFILLDIFRSLLKAESLSVSEDPAESVSVVVACRNEEENVQALMTCLDSQDYPAEKYEIIIVDDNSCDSTFELASGFNSATKISVLKNKGNGKKHAVRTGVEASSGSLIITTDADCRMGRRWIWIISAFFAEHKPDIIICPVRIKPGQGLLTKFQEMEFIGLQGVTAGTAVAGKATMCNGANLAFSREAYLDNAEYLHDEISSGDDMFLLHSIKKKKGSKILWFGSEDAMVTTKSSPSFISFLGQRRRWISKYKAYDDLHTIILAIVTFVTIFAQITAMVMAFINLLFLLIFLTILLIKSFPDFLLLRHSAAIIGRKKLLWWFIPCQVLYPFYVISVVLYALVPLKMKVD